MKKFLQVVAAALFLSLCLGAHVCAEEVRGIGLQVVVTETPVPPDGTTHLDDTAPVTEVQAKSLNPVTGKVIAGCGVAIVFIFMSAGMAAILLYKKKK